MEDGLDTLGAEDVMGVDYGAVLQTAGAAGTGAFSIYEQDKKEKEAKANESKNVNAVIAADVAASRTVAQAEVSALNKAPSASIDAQAAQLAVQAQDRAAAGLSAEAQKKRADAAEKALATAVSAAQAAPTDPLRAAMVRAWVQTVNKAQAGAIVASGSASGFDGYGGQSWWTRPVMGKVPGYGVLLIGAGGLGAAWLVMKKLIMPRVA